MRALALRFAFLGAAAALLAVLGVYALFTDSDSGTGSASAGTVIVLLGTSSDIGAAEPAITIVYDGPCILETGGPLNMKADQTCESGAINVFNGGTLTFSYTVSPVVLLEGPGPGPPALDCWTVDLIGPATPRTLTPGTGGLATLDIWTIGVTLDGPGVGDINDCQGKTATLGMEVTATQTP